MIALPVVTPSRTRSQTIIELIGDADARLARSFTETLAHVRLTHERVIVRLDRIGLVHADGLAEIAETILRERRGGRDIVVATNLRRLERLLETHKVPVTAPVLLDDGVARRHVMLVQRGRERETPRARARAAG